MITSLYKGVCNIWRRQESTSDGSKAADNYTLVSSDEPCIFLPKVGTTVPNDGTGRDIVVDGEFRTDFELEVTDKIAYNGYDHLVQEVQQKKDLFTNVVRYYRATVTRQRSSTESPVTII